MADQGVVIEVDVADDIADTNEAPRVKEAKDGDRRVSDVGADELKQQLERLGKDKTAAERVAADERRAREASDAQAARERQEADKARAEAAAAKSEGADAQRSAIDNAIAANKTALESAESELASAFEAGDFKKAAAIQVKIAKAGGELAQLESGKAALPAADTATGRVERKEPVREETRPPTESEKFERYVGQFQPKSQQWLRAHPETVTDPKKNRTIIRAHEDAIEDGLKVESDEYFEFIEQRLEDSGTRRVEVKDDPPRQERQPPRQEQQRTRPMASAPVSRENGSNGHGGNGRTSVELTPGEVGNATDGTIVWNTGPNKGEPIGTTEMARRKLALKKAGRYETPYA